MMWYTFIGFRHFINEYVYISLLISIPGDKHCCYNDSNIIIWLDTLALSFVIMCYVDISIIPMRN